MAVSRNARAGDIVNGRETFTMSPAFTLAQEDSHVILHDGRRAHVMTADECDRLAGTLASYGAAARSWARANPPKPAGPPVTRPVAIEVPHATTAAQAPGANPFD